jgi:hypothetical protein
MELLHDYEQEAQFLGPGAQAFSTDDTNLYWAEPDGIVQAGPSGAPIRKFCVGSGSIDAFIESDGVLYAAVSDVWSHTLRRLARLGGDWSTVTDLQAAATRLAADSGFLYWTEGGQGLWQVAKDGTGKRLLYSQAQQVLASFESDGTDVFSAADTGGTPLVVLRTTLGASAQTTQVVQEPGSGGVSGFGTDASHVYWNDGARIWQVGKDGSGLHQLGNQVHTSGVLTDGPSVYWSADAIGSQQFFGVVQLYKTDTTSGVTTTHLTKLTAYTGTGTSAGDTENVIQIAANADALYFATMLRGKPGNLYRFCK